MSFIKKYEYIYKFVIYILIINTIMTIVNLLFPISNTINQIVTLILISIYIFVINVKKGLKIEKKAYLEGIKLGFIYILTLYLLGIPFGLFKLPLKRIVYFIIIVIISVTSTIIGINKKTQ